MSWSPRNYHRLSPSLKSLYIAIAVATICKVSLALFTYGTNDASNYDAEAKLVRESQSMHLYSILVEVRDPQGDFLHWQIFNHPPFFVRVLSTLNHIADWTGIPVHTSLRLFDAAADVGSIVFTVLIVRSLCGAVPVTAMILIALAPSWIFISGFHSNTDPLMLFFLVLAVYLIEVRRRNSWGALSFALAGGIKAVPILLLPALFFYFKSWRERLRVFPIMVVFWLATAAPWLITDPVPMLWNVLGYASQPLHWGIGLIISQIPIQTFTQVFNLGGRFGMMALIIAISSRFNRGERPVSLFYQFGFLLFLFHLVTPGFGIQYLAWLTPWLATLPLNVIAAYVAASGSFCFGVYTYWSRGVPWYYANSITMGTWKGAVSLLGLVTWLTVAWVVQSGWSRFQESERLAEVSPASSHSGP